MENNMILLVFPETSVFSNASRCIKWKFEKLIQIKVTLVQVSCV